VKSPKDFALRGPSGPEPVLARRFEASPRDMVDKTAP